MKINTLATLIMAGTLITTSAYTWASDGDDGFRDGGSERSMSRDSDDYGNRNRDSERDDYRSGRYMDGSRDYDDQRCNGMDSQDGNMNCDSDRSTDKR